MRDVSKISVTQSKSMIDVITMMIDQKSREIVITDPHHNIEGIITGTDIVREIERAIDSSRLLEGTADFVMTERPTSVPTGTLMIDVVDRMYRHGLHVIVVTENYEAIGIITQLDVIKWWLEEYGKKEKEQQ